MADETTAADASEPRGPFEVHLLDGTVLHGAPHTSDGLRPIYGVLGDEGARASFPINDGSLVMLAVERINYIVWRPTQKEA